MDAPDLAGALVSLRACCTHLRLLGSYPCRSHRQDEHLDRDAYAALEPDAQAEPGTCPRVESMEPPAMPVPVRARSTFHIGPAVVGEGHFVLIAGPCAVESREQILAGARLVRAAGATMLRGGAFKPRTSPYAFQGLGVEGLKLPAGGRAARCGLPVVTEVLTIEDIPVVAEYADVLQVGARNMHNFALLKELGPGRPGRCCSSAA